MKKNKYLVAIFFVLFGTKELKACDVQEFFRDIIRNAKCSLEDFVVYLHTNDCEKFLDNLYYSDDGFNYSVFLDEIYVIDPGNYGKRAGLRDPKVREWREWAQYFIDTDILFISQINQEKENYFLVIAGMVAPDRSFIFTVDGDYNIESIKWDGMGSIYAVEVVSENIFKLTERIEPGERFYDFEVPARHFILDMTKKPEKITVLD